ncbi:hypothetical protein MBLNU230_g0435t1 [Neophaeotheca triangularis]
MASNDDSRDPQKPKDRWMNEHDWQAFFAEQDASHERCKQRLRTSMDPALYQARHPEPRRADEPLSIDANPFVAFRHFIDSNLHALADSFKSLPSNVADIRNASRERERDKFEELRRWTGDDTGLEPPAWATFSAKEREHGLMTLGILMGQSMSDKNVGVTREAVAALWQDAETNSLPFARVDAYATPSLSPGGACYYVRENEDNLPSTANCAQTEREFRWLSPTWFRRSPYSPVALNTTQSATGINYRAALEDLLSASLDKPLQPLRTSPIGTRWPSSVSQPAWEAPGVDWMLSLYCRKILPWPADAEGNVLQQVFSELRDAVMVKSEPKPFACPFHRATGDTPEHPERWQQEREALGLAEEAPSNDDDDDEFNPLDVELTLEEWAVMLEGMKNMFRDTDEGPDEAAVAKIVADLKGHTQAPPNIAEGVEERDEQPYEPGQREETARPSLSTSRQEELSTSKQTKPAVLSALTTTQTTRLPDGTVTTKVVLKQRFADGREETEEKMHTYLEDEQSADDGRVAQCEKVEEKPRKGGWFWI